MSKPSQESNEYGGTREKVDAEVILPQGVDSIIIRELADRHCDQTKYQRPLKVNNVPSRWLDLTASLNDAAMTE